MKILLLMTEWIGDYTVEALFSSPEKLEAYKTKHPVTDRQKYLEPQVFELDPE